jgi:predicted flap endonuclease-1-like 5' DNA nuclease
MSLLYRIIYAAHANGTHHKLALDALMKLEHPQAEAWRNVMLKHVTLLLDGSKDPDNVFKDFKNHVLHVKDGYWGGAPEKVQNWYQHLVAALKEQNWSEAAYAAGVLSHYYTDPIHPFHTGQTAAENNIHRAVEWSINRSYETLKRIADAEHAAIDVPVREGADWLKEMTCDGAEFSHRYYEKLIAHYDIHRGVVDPPSGLDDVSRHFVAELIAYASTGFARILDRAFTESGQSPPDVVLTADALIATLQIPIKMVQKRLSNAADREIVQRMYDELKATGTVTKNLPEDDRQVRDLHEKEVLQPRAAEAAKARAKRLVPPAPAEPRSRQQGSVAAPPAPAKDLPQQAPPQVESDAHAAARLTERLAKAEPAEDAELKPDVPRFHLVLSDNLEAAPSIGPKSALRFADIGVITVGDFLARAPKDMAAQLKSRNFSAQILSDWQAQARLVLSIPRLRGTHAQLLVGAGYRALEAIRAADPDALIESVLAFAQSDAGQKVLRDGRAPGAEKIRSWIENASAYAEAA